MAACTSSSRNDALNSNLWSLTTPTRLICTIRPVPFNNLLDQFPTSTCYAKQSPYRWNDFGFTIGGPVYFGHYNKDHNKTFFFYSQEWHYINNYNNV